MPGLPDHSNGLSDAMALPRFPLGRRLATPGALKALARNAEAPATFISRHERGDWGDLGPEDLEANEHALTDDSRLLSGYCLTDGTKIWIITEADRSATTILLPEEY